MLKKINITNEARLAIRGAALLPFRETGTQRANGTWDIPVEETTLEAVRRQQQSGETLSDTLIRLVATAGKRPN